MCKNSLTNQDLSIFFQNLGYFEFLVWTVKCPFSTEATFTLNFDLTDKLYNKKILSFAFYFRKS